MAPTKSSAVDDGPLTSSVLVNLKTPVNTKDLCDHYSAKLTYQFSKIKKKIRALGYQQSLKINKPSPAQKTQIEREYFKETIEWLSTKTSKTCEASSTFRVQIKNMNEGVSKENQAFSTLTVQDFEVGGTLGHGRFGHVYLARHISSNYVCALKRIAKSQCMKDDDEKFIRRELETHQNLVHRNILKLLSWFHDDRDIYLVLEYAPGGSLYSKLKKQPKGRFDEPTAAQYIAQMAEALRYMHSKSIMHRDIKPENILLGLYNEIKLADFGYSVHSSSGTRSTLCGTLDYLSPEMAIMMLKPGQSKEFYTKAVDQWSLGILMYELLVGKPPFEMRSSAATKKRIAAFKGKGLKFPGHVSKHAEELIIEVRLLSLSVRIRIAACRLT